MAKSLGRVNLIFAGLTVLLGAVALSSMIFHPSRAALQAPSAGNVADADGLPENHPPVETLNRLASLEQLSRDNPDNAGYKTEIGNTYYDLGMYRNAADAYEQSLKLHPADPGVETDLATCYHYLGLHDQALAMLDQALRRNPNYPQALFNKGVVLQLGKNDIPGALAVWRQLLETNPDYPHKAELEQKIRQLASTAK